MDLMITREGYLSGVQLVHVEADDAQRKVTASLLAHGGTWFSPDSPEADSDGYVRDVEEITADLTFTFADADGYTTSLSTLRDFEHQALCDLEALASLEHQAVVLLHRATRRSVCVRMSDSEQGN